MFYLIQKMLFKENNHKLLTDYLDKRGLEYEMVKFIPFVQEIEFKTKRKDIWCWGSPNMTHAALKYEWTVASMYNDNHDYEEQVKHWGDFMMNADGHVIDFTDSVGIKDEYFFARPTKDTKIFTGQVFTHKEWQTYVDDVSKNYDTHLISDESRILVAPAKNIQQEIRCWVIDGEVITTSLYRMNGRTFKKNFDDETAVLDFIKKMIGIFVPARAFVIDVALVDDEYKIIEINLINSAGFYEANIGKLVEAIEEKFG